MGIPLAQDLPKHHESAKKKKKYLLSYLITFIVIIVIKSFEKKKMTGFCNSIGIAIFGLFMLGLGCYLTYVNEANRVCTAKAYNGAEKSLENQEISTSIATSSSSSAFDYKCDPTGKRGDFVHLECQVDDNLQVMDPFSGIYVNGAYAMTLSTEIYSYEERRVSQGTKKNKSTCYCYDLKWTQNPVSNFKGNMCTNCYISRNSYIPQAPNGANAVSGLGTFQATAASVSLGNGAFVIGRNHIANIAYKPEVNVLGLPVKTIAGGYTYTNSSCTDDSYAGCWYSTQYRSSLSNDCRPNGSSQVCPGDTRIIVQAYGSKNLSLIGREAPNGGPPIEVIPQSFGGSIFPRCETRSIFYVSDGLKSASTLFGEMYSSLYTLTMFMRLVCFSMVCMGFYCFFSPIEAIVECIPICGECLSPMVQWVLGLFAFIAGLALWLFAFSTAWLLYNPIVGIPLTLIAIGCAYLAAKMQTENKKRTKGYSEIESFSV